MGDIQCRFIHHAVRLSLSQNTEEAEEHDGLFLSGSPPTLYICIHMFIFLMAKKLCCCCFKRKFKTYLSDSLLFLSIGY